MKNCVQVRLHDHAMTVIVSYITQKSFKETQPQVIYNLLDMYLYVLSKLYTATSIKRLKKQCLFIETALRHIKSILLLRRHGFHIKHFLIYLYFNARILKVYSLVLTKFPFADFLGGNF